jgi:Leucine-rich repeat (LRR) protein
MEIINTYIMKSILFIFLVLDLISCTNIEEKSDFIILDKIVDELGFDELGRIQIRINNQKKITELTLEYTKVKEIPNAILDLEELEYFTINAENLSSIEILSKLKKLSILRVKKSNIKVFPDITDFKELTIFKIENSRLKDTVIISNLSSKLFDFTLSSNHDLKCVKFHNPEFLKLNSLDICCNQIENIDSSIYQLPNLTHLYIYGNPLKEIELDKLQHLRVLEIDRKFRDNENLVKKIEERGIQITYYPPDSPGLLPH